MTASRIGSTLTAIALVAAVAAAALLLACGPGTRLAWWDFRTGLNLLRWAAYAALAGAVLGLVGLVLGGRRALAAVVIAVSLGVFSVPWTFQRRARAVPPIHDITTDTDDPPRF